MNKKVKNIVFFIITLLGFAMYVMLYFLVPFVDKMPILKYLILFLGYLSIMLFTLGLFNYRKRMKNNNEETNDIK